MSTRIQVPIAAHFATKAIDGTPRLKVFGWGSVSAADDGSLVVDHHKDIIEPAELEAAVYDFVADGRDLDADHDGTPRGHLIESAVFAGDKRKAMGLADTGRTGWWTGFELTDAATIERVKSGELAQLSIEYTADRHVLESDQIEGAIKGVKEITGPSDRKVGRLRKLKLHRLSLVTAGAGKGVDVTLYKARAAGFELSAAKGTKMELEAILKAVSSWSPEDKAKLLAALKPASDGPPPPEPEKSLKARAEKDPELKALLDRQETQAKELAEIKAREQATADKLELRDTVAELVKLGAERIPLVDIEREAKALIAARRTKSKEDEEYRLKLIKGHAEAFKQSDLIRAVGSHKSGSAQTAWEQLQAKAAELRKADPKLSEPQSITAATKANPALYRQYEAESRAQ